MIRKENRKNGFTLTETLVVVVIFMGVMSLSLGIFVKSIKNQRVALYQQRLVTESNYALKRIEEKVRNGEEITLLSLENYINNFTAKTITLEESKIEIRGLNDQRVTVFIKTNMKVDEENEVSIKLQTTITKR